jgi:ribosomal protein S18 acetylase RimI-like enzyme
MRREGHPVGLVEIRRLPAERWREYRDLRLESLKQSPLAFGSAFEEEASSSQRKWRKNMKSVNFAIEGGEPVGMIVCAFNREVKFSHIAEIYGFYVKPGHRGKGIGSALLEHVLRLARRNRRIIKVRLYVNSQQRAACRMYEKTGFLVTGRLEREMKVGGRLYTMLVMEKQLRG